MPAAKALEYPFSDPPAAGTAREVAPGMHWLRMPLPFALDHINLWLLEDDEEWVIVDCGIASDATRAAWEQLFAGILHGKRVNRVVVTHHHPDHLGLAGWLVARTGAEFWITEGEYRTGRDAREARQHAIDDLLALFARNGLPSEHFAALSKRNSYRSHVDEIPASFRRMREGESLQIGGRGWRVIIGRGHAPEHAALACEESGVLISGDMLLPRISTNVGVWPNDPEGNPLADFLNSLQKFRQLGADTLVLPSHGLPFRGAHARVADLEAHHALKFAALEAACATGGPRTASEVLEVLFQRRLDAQQLFFAMGEAIAHLHYLHRAGRLARDVGADRVIRYAAAQPAPVPA